jgi:chaperone modulatory protein CbpM
MHRHATPITGTILEEDVQLSLGDLSRACSVHAEYIMELVEEGIIDPVESQDDIWLFRGYCLKRVRTVVNLQRDLGINLAGVALALDLMQELDDLRAELDRLSRH